MSADDQMLANPQEQPAHPQPSVADVAVALPPQRLVDRLAIRFLPWMTSFIVNISILIVLALLQAAGVLDGVREAIEIAANPHDASYEVPQDLPDLSFSSAEMVASSSQAISGETESEFQPSAAPAEELNAEMLRNMTFARNGVGQALLDDLPRSNKPTIAGLPARDDMLAVVPRTTAKGPVTERELKERTSLQDIATDIGEEIKQKFGEESLLVVWLLDGSLSLVDNRQELAAHLDQMYAGLEQPPAPAKGQKRRILMNAVVGFGNGVQTISPPHRLTLKATNAMRQMGVDQTGIESTCQAIIWTALNARETWDARRGQLMIVVFTDESGDDIPLIEEAIEVCRQNKVSVSVIGPSAILGTDEGYHRWKHPEVAQPFWLPVLKGPDAALPERIRLPYWWSTENLNRRLNLPPGANEFPTDEHIAAEWQANVPEWARGAEVNPSDYFTGSYAGRELLNLNSGFPPWGLMRLTRETGGTYTMFDRRGDRGPFRLKLMRPYLPDYRSIAEIHDELKYHPMRWAILNSAMLTRKYAPRTTPDTRFWGGHIAPPSFRNYCKRAFEIEDKKAEFTARLIEEALAGFGPNGMESQYQVEKSPRWQAWYDLVAGRLMLQSVRHAEYRYTLRMISDDAGFPVAANQITLYPYATIRSAEVTLKRAEEGQRLLQRCLDKNPGTPWAFLAARELEHPLGIDFNWRYIPPPPPSPPGPRPAPSRPAPQIVLPKL